MEIFCGEKSIPRGAPCPCIVISGAGAWIAWLSTELNITYYGEKCKRNSPFEDTSLTGRVRVVVIHITKLVFAKEGPKLGTTFSHTLLICLPDMVCFCEIQAVL